MSAHVVDPATIDYLVAWITGHARSTAQPRTCRLWRRLEDVPRAYRGSIAGSEAWLKKTTRFGSSL